MTKPIIRIHNLETNEVVDREMTAVELKIYDAQRKLDADAQAEAEAKAVARQAILDRLGLTTDELKTILG